MLTMSEAVSFIPSSLAFSSGSSLDGCFRAVYSFALMPESPAIDLVWFRQLDLAPFDGLIWPHLKACDLSFRVGLGGRSP
jgi:hypothetical protein